MNYPKISSSCSWIIQTDVIIPRHHQMFDLVAIGATKDYLNWSFQKLKIQTIKWMSFSCCRKSGIKLSGSAAEGLITSYSLQILHNTSRALDLEARLARLEERSRHVQINDESLCDSCHARLGTKLFAMYPDDTIVCYKVGNMPLLLPLQVYIYICFP